jgi:WD40 repeat protein
MWVGAEMWYCIAMMLISSQRPRLSRKAWTWLLGSLLLATFVTFTTHAALVRQMRLPRLALNQGGSVIAVAITPDGRTIFGGAATLDPARLRGNIPADVFVWDTASGKLIRRLHGFDWRANAVTASPEGNNVIASGFTERNMSDKIAENKPDSILAWDWRSGQKVGAMAGAMPLSYSPDGRLIGCSDGVRQAVNGKLVIPIPKGLDEDSQTEFSADGTLFGFIGLPTLNKKGFMDSETGFKLYYSTTRLHLWRTDTGKEAQSFPFRYFLELNCSSHSVSGWISTNHLSRPGRRRTCVSSTIIAF